MGDKKIEKGVESLNYPVLHKYLNTTHRCNVNNFHLMGIDLHRACWRVPQSADSMGAAQIEI